jgi:hypothetical protein
MELFAAKRVKKFEDKAKLAKQQDEEMGSLPVPSLEQRIKLDRLFGFPEPPEMVYAIGSDESAKIWWTSSLDDPDVLSWEVLRYRFEKTNEWKFKGSLEIKYLKHVKQTSLNGLQNGYEVSLYFILTLSFHPSLSPNLNSTNSQSKQETLMD